MEPVFRRLPLRRVFHKPDWPRDLVEFYASHEGNGLELGPEVCVRLCKLHEVELVACRDILVLAMEPPGWHDFSGYAIGISPFFDRIVYVTAAPVCKAGSILLLGPDVSGPGGDGHARYEPTLVIGRSLEQWLRHLEECDWTEWGIYPGGLDELPERRREAVARYYRELNPHIEWG